MKKLLLFLFLGILAWSCQDLNSIAPPDEFDLNGQFGQLKDTVIFADRAEFKTDYRMETGYAYKLCVGNYENFRTGFFLKFFGLPTDTMVIDSAYIELTSISALGTPTVPLEINVYEVDKDWDENTVNTLDEWHLYEPSTEPVQITVGISDSLKTRIPISVEMFNKWRMNSDENHGLYFKATSNENSYIRQFESLETSNDLNWPKLYYFVNKDTVSEKDSVRIGYDATVFDYPDSTGQNIFNQAHAQNELLLSSGIASRVLVHFSGLENVPSNAVMQSANLLIDVNPNDHTLLNKAQESRFYIRSVKETDDALSHLVLDSSFVGNIKENFEMTVSGDSLTLLNDFQKQNFAKEKFQDIINKNDQTEWFYIQYKDEKSALSVVRLFGLSEEHPVQLHLRYFLIENNGL